MEARAPKNIKPMNLEAVDKRVQYMREKTNYYRQQNLENLHVSISVDGNSKTGKLISTVSLRPILDCGNCKACTQFCYDVRSDCRYKTVMDSRCKNAVILEKDSDRFFNEVSQACKKRFKKNPNAAFRWHVGGDILGRTYFLNMIKVAKENPGMTFLAFTKMYGVVNKHLDNGGEIPSNLQILFSVWEGLKLDNPYDFPTSHLLYADGRTTAPSDAVMCSHNCTECLLGDGKCWRLKKKQSVVLPAH